MANEGDKGAFSADIPEAAIAEALAAVEKRGRVPDLPAEPPPAAPPSAAPGAPGSLEAEVDRLRLELDLSQERARKVFEQLKDEHDRLLRTAADLENYKKRAAKERDDVQRYGNERLVKEILPALDNLDRALAAAPDGRHLALGNSNSTVYILRLTDLPCFRG